MQACCACAVIVLDEQVHNDSLQECSTCCMGLYSITNIDLYMFACTKCQLFDDIICVYPVIHPADLLLASPTCAPIIYTVL